MVGGTEDEAARVVLIQELKEGVEDPADLTHVVGRPAVATQGIDAPPGEVYFAAENPKGELGFYIHSKGGGVPYRLKIRSPSFCNLSIVSRLLPGHMVSDVPAILGSLDFVMGECDR